MVTYLEIKNLMNVGPFIKVFIFIIFNIHFILLAAKLNTVAPGKIFLAPLGKFSGGALVF